MQLTGIYLCTTAIFISHHSFAPHSNRQHLPIICIQSVSSAYLIVLPSLCVFPFLDCDWCSDYLFYCWSYFSLLVCLVFILPNFHVYQRLTTTPHFQDLTLHHSSSFLIVFLLGTCFYVHLITSFLDVLQISTVSSSFSVCANPLSLLSKICSYNASIVNHTEISCVNSAEFTLVYLFLWVVVS